MFGDPIASQGDRETLSRRAVCDEAFYLRPCHADGRGSLARRSQL